MIMKVFLKSFAVASLLLAPSLGFSAAPNREILVLKYPGLEDTTRAENPKILCPFHRMLERAGIYDMSTDGPGPLLVSVFKITSAAKEFGCQIAQCGTVATAVSGGQLATGTSVFSKVNIESLHTAIGVSNECGLSFAKGSAEVTESHRANTLAALASLQDEEGRLSYEDLVTVKESICSAQGVANTLPGKIEMKLIYSFLGGNIRGYIDYSDVERFLHAELPLTIGAPDGR
jgi:hypothetical protein